MQKQESCQAIRVHEAGEINSCCRNGLYFYRGTNFFAEHSVGVEYIIRNKFHLATLIRFNHMKTLLVYLLTLVWLPASAAFGKEAAVYFDLASKSSTAKKKIEYYSKALELDPNLASAYAKRGMLYYFQGKYRKVIEDFENYTRLQPDNAEGYRMLGMGYLYAGSYDGAIATFNQALAVDPHLISALCYRAEAYRRSGESREALADSTEAIQLAKEPRILADAYITRAKVYRELGFQDKAFADIRAALLKDPRTYFYRYVSSYASLEEMRTAGLIGIIVLAFILIFKLRFKAPKKDE